MRYFDAAPKIAAAAGTNELTTDSCPSGRIWVIERAAVENETTAYTALRLLKRRGRVDFLFEEEISPAAGRLYWTADKMVLFAGERLVAKLTGCTAGDVLGFYVAGYELLVGEEA